MRLDDNLREKVKDMIRMGLSDEDISKRTGVSKWQVNGYRTYMERTKDKPKKKKYRFGELNKYFAEGKSIDEVVEITGLKRVTVNEHYKYYSPYPTEAYTKVRRGLVTCEPNSGVRFTKETDMTSIWKKENGQKQGKNV